VSAGTVEANIMEKLYDTIPNADKQPETYIQEEFVLKADNFAKDTDDKV